MTKGEAKRRRRAVGETFLIIWGVALVPNTLDAFGFDPGALWWDAIRYALGAICFLALLVLIWAWIRERRAPAELA